MVTIIRVKSIYLYLLYNNKFNIVSVDYENCFYLCRCLHCFKGTTLNEEKQENRG